MAKEKCSICGAENLTDSEFCKHFKKPVCLSCCHNKCGYRKEAGICLSVCLCEALNLKSKHGHFLGDAVQIEKAYNELRVLPADIAIETYEYLRNEYRKGISNAEVSKYVREQLAALQRIIEDMRFKGQIKAAI